MSLLSNRSAMVLFHDDIGHRSQKVRIVIAEKGITCNLEVLNEFVNMDDQLLMSIKKKESQDQINNPEMLNLIKKFQEFKM